MPSLGNFLQGFEASRQRNQQADTTTINQAGALHSLSAALQKQAAVQEKGALERKAVEEWTALGPNPSEAQIMQFGGKYAHLPAAVNFAAATLDRRDKAAATQAQLEQAKQSASLLHEYRLGRLQTDQERAAENSRHNRSIEDINRQVAQFRVQQAPKPPQGYRPRPDDPTQLEPIPGGPKDTSARDAAKIKGAIQKSDIVIGKVNEALQLVSPATTGLVGDIRSTTLGRVTGSGAFDLEKTIDTIKANLGFSELQAMREASPTGGALGQVAVQELTMLQSTVASLDKGQDAKIVRKNLEQVKKHFENWRNAVTQSQQGAPAAPAAPAASGGGWSIRPIE